MLEGKNVRLRALEKENLPLFTEWNNDPAYAGEFENFKRQSLTETEKWFAGLRLEKWFIVEKRDGTKIGQVVCSPKGPHYSVGYRIVPNERNKGYCTEAVKIAVDHLFLSTDVVRVESEASPKNAASIKVLEKAGFTREGLIRKSVYINGEWEDGALYSMLRGEWKKPRILKEL